MRSIVVIDHFTHDGFDLAFLDQPPVGQGRSEPVLMIHGFASNHFVNWVSPGWFKTLTEAGYRCVAFDNRGHGLSSKSYDEAGYMPSKMARDAVALLDNLGIDRAHVMGYSMGARVSAFLALSASERVATLVFGGLGIGMVDGIDDWDQIADALLAEDPESITHRRGKSFRAFADQTRSNKRALAACITNSRTLLTKDDMSHITQPTLVAVGTTDNIAGSASELALLMPNAISFDIKGRDHMLTVGDHTFKKRVLEFYAEHPL